MESTRRTVGEKYNLRWNSHKTSLVNHLSEHLAEEELVDVTLACDGKYIKAHKLILSSSSLYFRELFQYHKADNPLIIMNNIKFEDLKYIIDFIYHGEIKVLDTELKSVLLLGNNLKIKSLSNIILDNFNGKFVVPNKSSLNTQQANGPSTKEMNTQTEPLVAQSTKGKSTQTLNNDKSVPKKRKIVFDNTMKAAKSPQISVKQVSLLKGKQANENDLNHGDSDRSNSINNSMDNQTIKRRKYPVPILPKITGNIEVDSRNVPPPQIDPLPVPVIPVNDTDNSIKIEDHDISEHAVESEANVANTAPVKPVSAFMLFANEWRNKLAVDHPNEGNKQISIRLSNMWKSLSDDAKEAYYVAASKAYEEQKSKFTKDKG